MAATPPDDWTSARRRETLPANTAFRSSYDSSVMGSPNQYGGKTLDRDARVQFQQGRSPQSLCFSGSPAKGIADADKDAAGLIIELRDGPAGHAAGETEVAEGALDPAIHHKSDLGCHGQGQASNALPAGPDAFRVIDGWGVLGWDPEIVAPLYLGEAESAANKGCNRRVEFEVIKGVDHHRIVPRGPRPWSSLIESLHPADAAAIFRLGAKPEKPLVAHRRECSPSRLPLRTSRVAIDNQVTVRHLVITKPKSEIGSQRSLSVCRIR